MEPAPKQPAPPSSPKSKIVSAPPPSHVAPKPAIPQISFTDKTASSVPAVPATSSVLATSSQTPLVVENAPSRDKTNIPALPLHAQLRFAVYLNGSSFSIGDLFQELNINEGRYTLLSELEKAGLASWFNSYQITQSSRGILSPSGDLVPEEFREEMTDAQGVHHESLANFDWFAKQLRFADGTVSLLPSEAQDRLSLLYQLSQFSFNTEHFPLTLTDGKNIENIRLEVGLAEEITTPMGKLRALHLRKMHNPGTAGMDVWLGIDYHMLPVKFQQTEADGKISEEWVIQEIRVSDEQSTNKQTP